jgi:tetratricopeptide (TPR) repeat protein/2-polyprenyl-3-methyl-5-hydroxy-6-metoxy-1,4-benzoquinol methylase
MELTIEQALQQAVEAHKAGKLQDAEALYQAILQAQPKHPDANHNLGVLAVSLNKSELALPLFKTALETNPNQGQFWLSYVDALIKERQFEEAKNLLEQGKKRGLTGEKVDALEAQLAPIAVVEKPATILQKQASSFTQQRKKVSAKKEKKKNSSSNQTNPNQFLSPSQVEVNSLLEHYQKGRFDSAENLAKTITQKFPDHQFSWKVLGAVFKKTGRLQESLIANQKVLEISPNNAEAHSNLGNALTKLGRLEDAEASYNKAIAIKPKYAEAHYNLGITLQELGRLEEAVASYKKAIAFKPNFAKAHSNLGITLQQLGRLKDAETTYNKAIAIKPDYAEAHSNLGITLQELGRLEEAETSYKKAIVIKPDYADAHYNLGNTLKELGTLQEAEASYKKAIAIKPDYAEAHSNLGNTLKELGRLEDAEASYKNAIAIKPNLAEAHSNLGNMLKELGRLEKAEASYSKAIAIKPGLAEAHNNLSITLKELGRLEDAFVTVIKSLKIKSTSEAKNLFVQLIKEISIQTWNQSLVELVIAALLEPWGRPSDVMPIACRLLKTDIELLQILKESKNDIYKHNHDESFLDSISKKDFGASSLLGAMLSSSFIADAEIEIFLTSLRRHVLRVAVSEVLKKDETEEIAALYCSLAQQCFINEYIFFQTPEEINSSHQLLNQLTKALENTQAVPAVWVISIACYFPLYSVAGSEKLLHQKWHHDVTRVLKQQIQEPMEELNLRASIPVLTSIDNQVSLAVKRQYEENPYPRWVRLPKDSSKKFLNTYTQSKFPLSSFRRLVDDRNPEILIAGCGTGQHSIGTSQSIKGAKILAVDLSMASLAYAKRKTAELDVEFIEYAQADLLKLLSLGRTFDVIESSGVLHHLENPFEGWKVLLSLLRPHGIMRLGFYSELGRQDIVRVRNLISKQGIGSTSQEIRDYRKHLLGLKDSFATSSSDFFSTSACRDLLFHVQEHRMNLKILADFFRDHDLNFLGFDIDSSVIRAYKNRFSNDPPATNLDQWRIYEEENPYTFAGMYQFCVQKRH